jgi:citrate synthase
MLKKPTPSSETLYLSAEEAAAKLNISVATLYTYVSRKNLRSQRIPGTKSSRYLRSDIEQFKAGNPTTEVRNAAPGLTNSSALTLVTEAGSYFRGRSAIEMSEHASLEDVARHLWDVKDDDPFDAPTPAIPPAWEKMFSATATYNAHDRLSMLLPIIEYANPRSHDLSKAGFLRSGVEIIRWSAAIALDKNRPTTMAIHHYLATMTKCGPKLEDAIRRVLVLAADQAFEPTTYAVRATANTGATPYRCIASGLAAATGKRLPSIRATSFTRFINEIDLAADPTEPIKIRVQESEVIPGFGYSPFSTPDPRAMALWTVLQTTLGADRQFSAFNRALHMGVELTGQHPEFSFLAAYISRRIGCDPYLNLVRIGRFVGWIAHALEQQTDRPLLRWDVNYNGPLPK